MQKKTLLVLLLCAVILLALPTISYASAPANTDTRITTFSTEESSAETVEAEEDDAPATDLVIFAVGLVAIAMVGLFMMGRDQYSNSDKTS